MKNTGHGSEKESLYGGKDILHSQKNNENN